MVSGLTPAFNDFALLIATFIFGRPSVSRACEYMPIEAGNGQFRELILQNYRTIFLSCDEKTRFLFMATFKGFHDTLIGHSTLGKAPLDE